MKKEKICFYENDFYMFSNFAAFTVKMYDYIWPTSEHLYQAVKFMDDGSKKNIVKEILNAPSPYDAKKIAKKYSYKKRKGWENIKVDMMKNIIKEKYLQHSYIQQKLYETDDIEIIENSPYDNFWGRGKNKKGRNELGKIWMEIRNEFKGIILK